MNKKWMTMAVFALVLMMMVVGNVAAQQSVLAMTTHGVASDDRDYFYQGQNIALVNRNMLFLTVRPGPNGPNPDGATVAMPSVFDIGAGFVFAEKWKVGLYFAHNFTNDYERTDSETVAGDFDPQGVVQTGTTTTNARSLQEDTFNSRFRLAVSFGYGNKWGIVNKTSWVDDSSKVKPTAGTAFTFLTAGTYGDGGTGDIALVNPANDYVNTSHNSGSSTITSNKFKAGNSTNASWSNNTQFGTRPANSFDFLSKWAPWLTVDFTIAYSEGNSLYGFERTYETETISAAGDLTGSASQFLQYDAGNSYYTITPAFRWDWGYVLTPNFRIVPRVGYTGAFRVYSNDVGSGSKSGTVTRTFADLTSYNGINGNTGLPMTTNVVRENNDVTERSYAQNTIYTHVQLNGTFETFAFNLRYIPSFVFRSESTKNIVNRETSVAYNAGDPARDYNWNETYTGYGNEVDIFNFTFGNQFILVGTWWIKPQKFRFVAAVSYSNTVYNPTTTTTKASGIASETTITKSYGDGHLDATTGTTTDEVRRASSETQVISSSPTNYAGNATFNIGLSYYLNSNISFDAFLGTSQASNDPTWANINPGPGASGFFNLINPLNWGIQFSVKW